MGWLRLFLALNVLVFHVHYHAPQLPYLMRGSTAVWLFYVISGFYMALVLTGKYPAGRTRLFYANRVWRLLPGYGLALVLVAGFTLASGRLCGNMLCVPLQDPGALTASYPPAALVAAAAANLLVWGQDLFWLLGWQQERWVYFAGPDRGSLAPLLLNFPAYTLACELFFYALAPLFVRSPRRLLAAGLLAAAYHVGLWLSGNYVMTLYYFIAPSSLLFFCLGAGLHHLRAGWPAPASPTGTGLWLGALLLVVAAMTRPETLIAKFLLVAALLMVLPMLFAVTARSRIDRAVGELSYPVYILHVPVLQGIAMALGRPDLAVLMARFVDLPVDRWRQRRVAVLLPDGGRSLD